MPDIKTRDIPTLSAERIASLLAEALKDPTSNTAHGEFESYLRSISREKKEDVFYIAAKTIDDPDLMLSFIKTGGIHGFPFMPRSIMQRALEDQNLQAFKNLCLNENNVSLDFYKMLEKVDLNWFKTVYPEIKKDILSKSPEAILETSVYELLIHKRYDLFDYIVDDPMLVRNHIKIFDQMTKDKGNIDALKHLIENRKLVLRLKDTYQKGQADSLIAIWVQNSLHHNHEDIAIKIAAQAKKANIWDTPDLATALYHATRHGQLKFIDYLFENDHIQLCQSPPSACESCDTALIYGQNEALDKLLAYFEKDGINAITTKTIKKAISNDNIDGLRILLKHGYKFPEEKADYFISQARTIETIGLLHNELGLSLPEDKRGFLSQQFNHQARRYAETLYRFTAVRKKTFDLSPQDKKDLSKLSLPQLRKTVQIGEHPKITGMAMAAQAGAFDIIIKAALKYEGKNPFDHMDWTKEDKHFKSSLIAILRATKNVHRVFNADFWEGKETELKGFWQRYIPDVEKTLYKTDYEGCLHSVALQRSSSKNNAPKISRRRIK